MLPLFWTKITKVKNVSPGKGVVLFNAFGLLGLEWNETYDMITGKITIFDGRVIKIKKFGDKVIEHAQRELHDCVKSGWLKDLTPKA